jgi:bacteriocin biosynthesis cyclodehydratase domain-containing protein
MSTHIKVLADGSFGRAVGQRMGGAGALRAFLDAPEAGWDFIAVALTHKRIDAMRALSDWCHANGTPWAVAFMADSYLYCGPVFAPRQRDGMACFDCFYKRDLSHLGPAREIEREAAIDDHFNRHAESEVAGFSAGAVGMAAAFLKGAAAGAHGGGKLRRINLLSGEVEDTEVLGIHHCARCAPARDACAVQADFARFSNELRSLLA